MKSSKWVAYTLWALGVCFYELAKKADSLDIVVVICGYILMHATFFHQTRWRGETATQVAQEVSGLASCQHPGNTYDNVLGEGPQDLYTGSDLDVDADFPLALACACQALDVVSDKETEHLLEAFIASQSRILKVIPPLPHVNGTHLREVIQIAVRLQKSDSTLSPVVYIARPSLRFPPSHLQAFLMPLQVDKDAKILLLYATHDQQDSCMKPAGKVILEALDKKGHLIFRDYALKIAVLLVGANSKVGGLREFCALASFPLAMDCVMLATFYTVVLTIMLEGREFEENPMARPKLLIHTVRTHFANQPSPPRVDYTAPAIFDVLASLAQMHITDLSLETNMSWYVKIAVPVHISVTPVSQPQPTMFSSVSLIITTSDKAGIIA
ncbi:hypothetical protein BC835DRAFT_1454832 [Cytidiella melzeri]|nr:hypothetical protein BC835DRAFT_1454832 [Cytidiella melzeri]